MEALDLAYLNSLEFALRLNELFEARRLDQVMELSDIRNDIGQEASLAEVCRVMECEARELAGFLAAIDAAGPHNYGAEIARLLGLDMEVTAVVHVDREAGKVGFRFVSGPAPGPALH